MIRQKLEAKDYSILHDIQTWEDWAEIEECYSKLSSNFCTTDEQSYQRQENRLNVNINGTTWKPITREYSCDQDIDIEVFFNNLRDKAYEKLENVSLEDRIKEFDGFNLSCFHCAIRTENLAIRLCPICNRSLTSFIVNWEDD